MENKMGEGKINIYKRNGTLLGYFSNPKIEEYSEDEYEISGIFSSADGSLPERLDFNPQALPYWAESTNMPNLKHARFTNVYVQKGRQPVRVSALGS